MRAFAKALTAGVIGGLASAGANTSGSRLHIIQDILAAFVAFNATYFVPNKVTSKAE